MQRRGRAWAGYTLTEILMAVGVLGVGMTMVASIFPVAVDQSRQSTDTTMAALSARSTAANLRANRENILRWCREGDVQFPDGAKRHTSYIPTPSQRGPDGGLSPGLPTAQRIYNPESFLYEGAETGSGSTKVVREYRVGEGQYGLWAAGSYSTAVFATPMDPTPKTSPTVAEGPWRITIVVFKGRGGQVPDPSNLDEDANNDKSFQQNPARVGEYLIYYNPNTRTMSTRGEAFKIGKYVSENKWVFPSGAAIDTSNARDPRVYIAGESAIRLAQNSTNNPLNWMSLRGSIAAYHTILGD